MLYLIKDRASVFEIQVSIKSIHFPVNVLLHVAEKSVKIRIG